jgi:hypothetical protein
MLNAPAGAALRAFGAGRKSTALPARFEVRAANVRQHLVDLFGGPLHLVSDLTLAVPQC